MEIFDSAENSLGLTHAALCQYPSVFVFLAYQNANNLTALGAATTPTNYFVHTGLLKSTNTKTGITNPLAANSQSARKLLAFTPTVFVGHEIATGITYTLANYATATKLLAFSPTATQGSEWNTTLNAPITFIGPYYGVQAWIGYTGYYRFVSSIVTGIASNTLVITHDVVRLREVSVSQSHSLSITQDTTADNVKIGSNDCALTQDCSAVKEHTESPSHTIGLTDEAIAFGNQLAEHSLTLTHDVLGLGEFVRAVENSCDITHDVVGGMYLFASADNTLSATDGSAATTERPAAAMNTITISHGSTGEVPAVVSHSLALTHGVVLSGIFTRSGTHTLALSHLSQQHNVERAVTSTLVMSHDVVPVLLTTYATQSLELTHSVSGSTVSRTASNSLTLTHSVLGSTVSRTASNSLALTHAASGLTLHGMSSNSLAMSHVTVALNSNYTVENALTLTHNSVFAGTITAESSSQIGLTQNIISFGSIFNTSASNDLSLTQVAAQDTLASASNSLSITQSAVASYGLVHSLGLSHEATIATAKSAVNTINLTHTAVANGPFSRSLSHTIGLMHSIVALANLPNLCGYAPTINSGNPNYTPPSASGPTISAQTDIVLTYPYVSPTMTLALRTPNISDKEIFGNAVVVRETRGGTLKVFRKTTWPKTTTLHVQVAFNTYIQAQSFLDFVETSLGQEVGYRDQLNRQWRGIIISPEDGFEQPGRYDRTLAFQFEGVLA